jgi:hypothetical protein
MAASPIEIVRTSTPIFSPAFSMAKVIASLELRGRHSQAFRSNAIPMMSVRQKGSGENITLMKSRTERSLEISSTTKTLIRMTAPDSQHDRSKLRQTSVWGRVKQTIQMQPDYKFTFEQRAQPEKMIVLRRNQGPLSHFSVSDLFES